jgi:hypothetical protein
VVALSLRIINHVYGLVNWVPEFAAEWRFLAQNKEIPNFYLKVVRPSPLAAGLSGESFA